MVTKILFTIKKKSAHFLLSSSLSSIVVAIAFNLSVYTVSEEGPSIMICLDLVDGFVGASGETITVRSIEGEARGELEPSPESNRPSHWVLG